MTKLNIAIVSETLVQQHYLKHAVMDNGYTPSLCLLVGDMLQRLEGDIGEFSIVDAWVLDVDLSRLDDSKQWQQFEEWLGKNDKPIICGQGKTYNAGDADFDAWSRQLAHKLRSIESQIHSSETKAQNVWILAASTGGPEVVKQFVDAMEPDLDIAFIYVQHIDHMQYGVLAESITRDSPYKGAIARDAKLLTNNELVVIPADQLVDFKSNGIMSVDRRKWPGVYSPSINQVVANIANEFGRQAGVIFFTGMGDDGLTGARLMALHGGQVWAQSLTSCTITSMPETIIKAGLVSYEAEPKLLADKLARYLKSCKSNKEIEKHYV